MFLMFFIAAPVQHANLPEPGPATSLIITLKIENEEKGLSITEKVLVDGGCEVTPLLLRYSDIQALDLAIMGECLTLLGDHQSVRTIAEYSPVKVTLTFNDGEEISIRLYPSCFVSTSVSDTPVIVAEDERILGYPALRSLGLKQDYKKHCLIKAMRRL